MIKQIVDFSRELERGTAIIDVFMMVEDSQKYVESIRSLAKDGAVILSADGDTIRARYKGVTQDKLLELLEEGWSFAGHEDEASALQCQDQANKGLCGECIEP
jgi:hypothetical protein